MNLGIAVRGVAACASRKDPGAAWAVAFPREGIAVGVYGPGAASLEAVCPEAVEASIDILGAPDAARAGLVARVARVGPRDAVNRRDGA